MRRVTVLEDTITYAESVAIVDAANEKQKLHLHVGECWQCHRPHIYAAQRNEGKVFVGHHEKTCGRLECGKAADMEWAK